MEPPELGQLFSSRYRVDGLLGEGGFAFVYRATDLSSHRVVALKVLKPSANGYSGDTESRFAREVRVLASLTDPHTVTMFDHGRADNGLLYMVFEHISGSDLSELLARVGRLEPPEALHILRQVLASLREAHALGLLHRDLKPENVRLYEYMGDPLRVKLLDFGIAKPTVVAKPSRITQTGQLVGTPRYMSPEQLLEKPLGPASDIYSLGLMAYEMLMGRNSIQGNQWQDQFDRLMSGHVFAIPGMERVGLELVGIVGKMSARKVEDRFQSAAEVLAALDQLPAFVPPADTQPLAVLAASDSPSRPESGPPTQPRLPAPASTEVVEAGQWAWAVPVIAVIALAIAILGAQIAGHEPEPVVREDPVFAIARSKQEHALAAQKLVAETVIAVEDAGVVDASADVSVAVGGCGESPPFEGRAGMIVSGLDAVLVHVPRGYTPGREYPVVFLFHQDTVTAASFLEQTGFGELADEKGFIVVAPNAKDLFGSWGDVADFGTVTRAFDIVNAELCVDLRRVFVVGHLLGGRMAEAISCEPWVTAVATNSHRRDRNLSDCGKRPIPYLNLAPMNSDRLPLEGGMGCVMVDRVSFATYQKIWMRRNRCSGKRKPWKSADGATCYRYACKGAVFSTCEIEGGAMWGGSGVVEMTSPVKILGAGRCRDATSDFPATETIWNFFERSVK